MGLCADLAPGLHRRSQTTVEVQAMDDNRFDTLAQVFGTRRGLLYAGAGAALAGVLQFLHLDDATEARKKKKKPKKKPKNACSAQFTIRCPDDQFILPSCCPPELPVCCAHGCCPNPPWACGPSQAE